MKKKIVIIGSTGSIGLNTLKLINKEKNKYSVELLSTNKNVDIIVKQAKKFNVKHVIINDYKKFIFAKEKYKLDGINFYNSFSIIKKIFKNKKIHYSMISVIGLDGLLPTIKLIKHSQTIGIANKESIICGWSLINKELTKYKTTFIPIDSEHFSIFSLIKNESSINIDKIFITASGGPFLNSTKKEIKNATIDQALKHPNWIMGKKITIDSATMMNKVFEVIETKKIFNIDYKNIKILIHPISYIHAIVQFKSAIFKILLHETDMKIPIMNSLLLAEKNFDVKKFKSKPLNLENLNDLNLGFLNDNHFPLVKILKTLPKRDSLFETVLVSVNDFFVNKFLEKRINYINLLKMISYYVNHRSFSKFKKIYPQNIEQIYKVKNFVNLKLNKLVYKKSSHG